MQIFTLNQIPFGLSGLKKTEGRSELGVGERLIKTYLLIVKQMRSSQGEVSYQETTGQTKLDVACILMKMGFESKTKSIRNRFSLYKKGDKYYYYTEYNVTQKGGQAGLYTRLEEKPGDSFKKIGEVYIGQKVKYRLRKPLNL